MSQDVYKSHCIDEELSSGQFYLSQRQVDLLLWGRLLEAWLVLTVG